MHFHPLSHCDPACGCAHQVEYDGRDNLYVYGTLLERPPVDNTDIQHAKPHAMEDAFLFLGGSVRSQLSSSIVTPEGKVSAATGRGGAIIIVTVGV